MLYVSTGESYNVVTLTMSPQQRGQYVLHAAIGTGPDLNISAGRVIFPGYVRMGCPAIR